MRWRARLGFVLAAAVAAVGAVASPAMAQFDPIGTEPTQPYPQPTAANLPRAGCATTLDDPTETSGSIPAVQAVYAWSDEYGDNYETYVEVIAEIVDRVDWLLDESTNYDQHVNLSCRSGFDTSNYSGYAHAMVVPAKIESANIGGETSLTTVANDLTAAGYGDQNRIYLVFEDFDGTATGRVDCYGKTYACVATTDDWDSGTMGHEMLHTFGVKHAWGGEGASQVYVPDIMISQTEDWQLDQDFNSYYDPSEPSAAFNTWRRQEGDGYLNIADHPVLTAPVCCDVGYNNDLLTAQERTIEADPPWSSPTGFGVAGGGWLQVTSPGSDPAVSARYYDGRRSLTMNVQSHAEGVVSVTRKPAVSPGTRYKLFTRLTTNTSGTVQLRLDWYDASDALISTSAGSAVSLDPTWREYSVAAVAPPAAAQVRLSVVSPAGQNFAYVLDSLQLNECVSPMTPDGCRLNASR